MRSSELIGILLFLGLIGCAYSVSTLKSVCRPESGIIDVIKTADVKRLISEFKQDETNPTCSQFKNSFLELEQVISDESLADICSEKTYQSIRSYHNRFISIYSPEADKEELYRRQKVGLEPIPKALTEFFLLFVSRIARLCSRHLIREFHQKLEHVEIPKHALEHLNDARLEARRHLLGDTSKHLLRSHFREIPLLPHVESENLNLVLNSNVQIYKTSRICEKKYNPIYEELFSPMIRLNNLGYGVYILAFDEEEMLDSKPYKPWIEIIETCEIIKNVNFIIDNESKEPMIVSQEEAERLKSKLKPFVPDDSSIETIKGIVHVPISYDEEFPCLGGATEFLAENERLIGKKISFKTTLRLALKTVKKLITNNLLF